MFVSVGSGGTIITSPNGMEWIKQTINNITGIFQRVIYAKTFIIVGEDGIFVGSGSYWTKRSTVKNLTRIIYGNNFFVAVWDKTILTSTDYIYWTVRSSGVASWYGIAYGNNSYAAVGNNPITIATSPDGITWTKQTLDSSAPFTNVLYGKNMFVIMGAGKIFACDISTAISLL
jgi:hypothetical protein